MKPLKLQYLGILLLSLCFAYNTHAQPQFNIGLNYSKQFQQSSIDFFTPGRIKFLNNLTFMRPTDEYGIQAGIKFKKIPVHFELAYSQTRLVASQKIFTIFGADFDPFEFNYRFQEYELKTYFELNRRDRILSIRPFIGLGILALKDEPIEAPINQSGIQVKPGNSGDITLEYNVGLASWHYNTMMCQGGLAFAIKISRNFYVSPFAGYKLGLHPVFSTASNYELLFPNSGDEGIIEGAYAVTKADRIFGGISMNYIFTPFKEKKK